MCMSMKQNHTKNTGPWYKHFWPWYLVFMKLAVVTAIIVTVILIKKNPTAMVVDDYYNEGRAINFQLDREERAAELGIELHVTTENQMFILKFPSGEPEQRTAVRVMFYHPTLDDRDFDILVPHASNGVYRAEFPENISGHWRMDFEPFDSEWRISRSTTFPLSKELHIIPDV